MSKAGGRALIGVLTHHWAKDGLTGEARDLLDRNGQAQSRFPGFGARQTLYSLGDATKITTLVTWESNEAYDAWRASLQRAESMAGADALWAKPPKSERFEVA
jgi:heme-degrading monooxygenase HmoA